MHSYASDSTCRRVSPWVIAVIAVVITYLFNLVADAWRLKIPWWSEAPSVMSVYGLLYWVYNRRGWRWTLGGVRLSQIPDCSGTWFGNLMSTHNDGTEIQGMLTIHQTWMEIVVLFRTDSSNSCSRMAALNVTPGGSEGLVYEYINDPSVAAADTMHAHRGFAFLKLSADGQCLEGDYYTGRDRANQGRIKLCRLSQKPMDISQAKATYDQIEKVSK